MVDNSGRRRRSTISVRAQEDPQSKMAKRGSIQDLQDHQILALRSTGYSSGYKKLMKEMSDVSNSTRDKRLSISSSSRRDNEVDRRGSGSQRRRRSSSVPKQLNGMPDMSKSSQNGMASSSRRRSSVAAKHNNDEVVDSSQRRRRSSVIKQQKDGGDPEAPPSMRKGRTSEKLFLNNGDPKPKKITSEMWLMHSDHLNKVQLASKDALLREKAAAELNNHMLAPKKFGPDPTNDATDDGILGSSSLPYKHMGSKHTYRHLGSIPTQRNTQDGIFATKDASHRSSSGSGSSDKKTKKKKKKKDTDKQHSSPKKGEHGNLQGFLEKSSDHRPHNRGGTSIISSFF